MPGGTGKKNTFRQQHLRNYPAISLEELRKTTAFVSQDTGSPGSDLNLGSTGHKTRALTTRRRRSVRMYGALPQSTHYTFMAWCLSTDITLPLILQQLPALAQLTNSTDSTIAQYRVTEYTESNDTQ
jgi:hypothetical protein